MAMQICISLPSRNKSDRYNKSKKNNIKLPIFDEVPLQASPTRVVVEVLQQQCHIK